jgi:hypothetical protein
MKRREFIQTAASTLLLAPCAGAKEASSELRITRIVGFYMQLHIGRAITNLYRAEHDPPATDVLATDGYRIQDGYCRVPEAPGFGLRINEDRFAANARVNFDLKL